MNGTLAGILDAFAARRVLVVGDAVLDRYLEGSAARICREAPVPTVALGKRDNVPGGAANTAVNVRALGGETLFLSVVGDDVEGAFLRQALQARGVAPEHLLVAPGRQTIAKCRVVAEAQILLRFDQGDTGPLDAATESQLVARLRELYPLCDAVILSDYGAGVLGPAMLAAVRELQARHPRVLVADSRYRLSAFRDLGLTAVKPNWEEAARLLDLPEQLPDRPRLLRQHADRLLERTGAQFVAVTLDADGALFFERGQPAYHVSACCEVRHGCVAGAGDTFVSALTLALAAGADRRATGELACAAAAVVVRKDGTATCSASELREAVAPQGKVIADLGQLAGRVEFLRRQGLSIAFTNGCFDILHRGHVSHLNHARHLADVLIVGVNSDESVRRLKGPDRPINPLEDRLGVLAALDCIDHLVPFDADTACDLVRVVRPDVFVKGGNHRLGTLPEAELAETLGGVVQILPYLSECSTAGLIERIRSQQDELASPPLA